MKNVSATSSEINNSMTAGKTLLKCSALTSTFSTLPPPKTSVANALSALS